MVHFPIALGLVALLFELLARHRRLRHLSGAAAWLITLAAVGAIAAMLSGDLAHHEAVVPQAAKDLMEQHEELGELAMWAMVVAAAVRLLLAARSWFGGWLAWAYLVLALCAVGLVAFNASLGGKLVYDHGTGTAPMQRSGR